MDFAYADVATNLYLTSFKRLNITNYLFIALNKKCCDVLHARGIHCMNYFPEFADGLEASAVGSASYNNKVNKKAVIALESLKLGFNPFLVDLDIVFFSDPGKIAYSLGKTHDLVVQDDSNGLFNTGFYYTRSTPKTIDLFTRFNRSQTKAVASTSDQNVIRGVLKSMKDVKLKLLDVKKFLVGNTYWEIPKRGFNYEHPWKTTDGSHAGHVIIHNNWLATEEAKIYRMRESLLWMVDENGYYSSKDRKYLVYDNPFMKISDGIELERDALVNALSIGYLLNRTVILPTFHCHSKRGAYFCTKNAQECPLMALYSMSSFDKSFSGAYREHVFLSHDLVPESTRQSRSTMNYIATDNLRKLIPNLQDGIRKFSPKNMTTGATPAEIQQWFGKVREKLLVFHNLYGAFAGLAKTADTETIRNRLASAFVPCNYRQRRCDKKTWF